MAQVDKTYLDEIFRRFRAHGEMAYLAMRQVKGDPELVVMLEPESDIGLIISVCERCFRISIRMPEDYNATLSLGRDLCCVCAYEVGQEVNK